MIGDTFPETPEEMVLEIKKGFKEGFKGHSTTSFQGYINQVRTYYFHEDVGLLKSVRIYYLVYLTWREFKKNGPGPHLAKILHAVVDDHIESFKKHNVEPWKGVTCGKCSGCCHTNVSINRDEAKLLAERVRTDTPIDMERLKLQAEIAGHRDPEETKKFGTLSYEQRTCVFLSQEGLCRIYKDRPAACRKWFVMEDPKSCENYNGGGKIMVIPDSEVVTSAAFNLGNPGRLPLMLYEELVK